MCLLIGDWMPRREMIFTGEVPALCIRAFQSKTSVQYVGRSDQFYKVGFGLFRIFYQIIQALRNTKLYFCCF